MNKYSKLASEFTGVMGLILIFTNIDPVLAAFLPVTDPAQKVFTEGDIPIPPSGSGQEALKSLILGALSYGKVIVMVLGILFISILGLQLIISSSNEEDIKKAKTGIIYALIAFVIVSMSQDLAKVFDMEKATLLASPQEILKRVHIFDKQVEIFMVFIKYVIGAFATVMMVQASVKLITSGGNEEETTKNKKSILYSAGGLLLIYVGEIFANKVFYKVDKQVYSGITGVHPGVDVRAGVEQITGITNLIVTFAAPVAVLMLIAGAVMYATAGGEQEKTDQAKRLIMATVIGIIVMYGAFAIVSTALSSQLNSVGALVE